MWKSEKKSHYVTVYNYAQKMAFFGILFDLRLRYRYVKHNSRTITYRFVSDSYDFSKFMTFYRALPPDKKFYVF